MPKTKSTNNFSQTEFQVKYNDEIQKLTKGLENQKYFVFYQDFFEDYYKIANCISNIQSILRYDPSPETSSFIEITSSSETKSVIKIPIITTNVKNLYIAIMKHVFSFSESNGIIIISFDDEDGSMKIVSSFKPKKRMRLTYIDNNNFFALGNQNETTDLDKDNFSSDIEEDCEEEEEDYCVKKAKSMDKTLPLDLDSSRGFDSVSEEVIRCNNNDDVFIKIKLDVIKAVTHYASVNFDYFKKFFKKLDTLVNVSILDNQLLFKSYDAKSNKEVCMSFPAQNVDPDYLDKEINFIINSSSITRLKSLNKKYTIVPDTKMFQEIELKIVADKDKDGNVDYGITIFPGNLNSSDQEKLLRDMSFDVYNSVLIYIPQNY